MSDIKQGDKKKLFYMYIAFGILCSIGILLMPIGSMMSYKTKMFIYISGLTFWIGCIGLFAVMQKINISRKRCKGFSKKTNQYSSGLIHFFENQEARVADIAMFAVLGCFVISKLIFKNVYAMYIFFSMFVFAFAMHCMFNGVNYKYIKYKGGREKV